LGVCSWKKIGLRNTSTVSNPIKAEMETVVVVAREKARRRIDLIAVAQAILAP
jgi:hypothetical protein